MGVVGACTREGRFSFCTADARAREEENIPVSLSTISQSSRVQAAFLPPAGGWLPAFSGRACLLEGNPVLSCLSAFGREEGHGCLLPLPATLPGGYRRATCLGCLHFSTTTCCIYGTGGLLQIGFSGASAVFYRDSILLPSLPEADNNNVHTCRWSRIILSISISLPYLPACRSFCLLFYRTW